MPIDIRFAQRFVHGIAQPGSVEADDRTAFNVDLRATAGRFQTGRSKIPEERLKDSRCLDAHERRRQFVGVPYLQAVGKKHDLHAGVTGIIPMRYGIDDGLPYRFQRQFVCHGGLNAVLTGTDTSVDPGKDEVQSLIHQLENRAPVYQPDMSTYRKYVWVPSMSSSSSIRLEPGPAPAAGSAPFSWSDGYLLELSGIILLFRIVLDTERSKYYSWPTGIGKCKGIGLKVTVELKPGFSPSNP